MVGVYGNSEETQCREILVSRARRGGDVIRHLGRQHQQQLNGWHGTMEQAWPGPPSAVRAGWRGTRGIKGTEHPPLSRPYQLSEPIRDLTKARHSGRPYPK